ncbi:DNA polymerase III subunit delta' [Janibacter sp. YIM B02568]|uniref:DNA polymerase III subunit delta' n=1 Tax=Janibacter endophyticus TaxID=2806261 RepID=UPI00194EE539|nr:DNA polymerase III subunit delta' [Janibacter endophyticus]MBM6547192.1 DNA polymerase III subunit delta' [Janibacter endophyticus]
MSTVAAEPAGVWRDVVGQGPALAVLQRAVADEAAMTHAWLFTGPPGSGRSVAARAFAGALMCARGGCGECKECATALDGTHADVDVLSTEALSIGVAQARELVQLAGRAPSVGRWRVILVEDADRLTEHSGNALLKALEEPTPRTVWLLCAPAPDDVLVTVRSRSRHVRLRTPAVEDVAVLLIRRDGIDPPMAHYSARAAQSHIGMARRLATDEGARIRRRDTITLATRIRGVSDAVGAAADLVQIAEEERDKVLTDRLAEEKAKLLATLGAEAGARTQPPHVRAQITALEKSQKTRATRFTRDMIDRSLTDLLSVYRDALVVRTGATVGLINEDARSVVDEVARALTSEQILRAMDAIGVARRRIDANVAPLLALESMAIDLTLP